jgi:hypothetical protein
VGRIPANPQLDGENYEGGQRPDLLCSQVLRYPLQEENGAFGSWLRGTFTEIISGFAP